MSGPGDVLWVVVLMVVSVAGFFVAFETGRRIGRSERSNLENIRGEWIVHVDAAHKGQARPRVCPVCRDLETRATVAGAFR